MSKALQIEDICMVLFESATEGLVVVDAGGHILVANPRAGELFGYAREELIGSGIDMLVPAAMRGSHAAHRASYNERPTKRSMGADMNLSAQRKDGSLFPVEVSLNHFVVDGQMLAMALISDITERRKADEKVRSLNDRLEGEVKERTRELVEALEREKEMNDLKSRFVATASHEFRTPLSTILSSAGLAERYLELGDEEKVQKHFTRIKSSVQNLTDILNDFLSLDRLEQGRIETEPTELDIAALTSNILEQVDTLRKPGQSIDYKHEGPLPFLMDEKIWRSVVLNLVSNAIKYSSKQISVATLHDATGFTLIVADQGMGIPEGEQKHLFSKFFRAKNANSIQGTGLGLNIVKRYVELMGGKITFTSTEGKGTTFTIYLPQDHS